MVRGPVEFGFVAAPADRSGASDAALYREILADCEYYGGLGFSAAWMIEHHFSDYFPTPDPLMALSHIAARFPALDLGTCVLVLPWHDPLRLAEQIAMLSILTDRRLHLGLGRGTAKLEYDAWGLDMGEARQRFTETYEIVRRGLAGESLTFVGEHLQVPSPVRVRPEARVEQITFYGAIGSAESAAIMGRMGLPPICTSMGDYDRQRETIENWRSAASEVGPVPDDTIPIMVNCIIADTDVAATMEAREYIPQFMQAQVDHYQTETTDWAHTKGYEAWQKIFAAMQARTVAENIDPWTDGQLIGSPETVTAKIEKFIDAGFNHFILHQATPGVPREVRHRWARLFALEVAPSFAARSASVVTIP